MDSLRLVNLRDEDPDHTEAFYRQLHNALAENRPATLSIDLSPTSFITPDAVMTLVTAARLWYRETGRTTMLMGMRPDIHRYLDRMNVFVACRDWIQVEEQLEQDEQWSRSRASRKLLEVIPIAADLDTNAFDVTNAVVRAQRILTTWFDANRGAIAPITTVLSEITSNIIHSEDRGFAAIQHHQLPRGAGSGGRVTIAVADLGIGIEASLQRTSRDFRESAEPAVPTGSGAILRALELGVTSRGKVGGTGLHLVRTIAEQWHGSLAIRSCRSRVRITGQQIQYQDELVYVPGTQVTIALHGSA